MGGQTDAYMDKWMDSCLVGWMDDWIAECLYARISGPMNGRLHARWTRAAEAWAYDA
jgi:hypothetical protein